MNEGGSPHGVYGDPRGVYGGVSTESIVDSPWSPLYFGESLWTPCGFYVDCRKYSHGLPLKSMESSWSPWKPVGECKVLMAVHHMVMDGHPQSVHWIWSG